MKICRERGFKEGMIKNIKKSIRGLTFSLDPEFAEIGSHFNYYVDKKNKEILIVPENNGKSSVSKKKCGNKIKALYDIRSKEVKELCRSADYIQIEITGERIIARTFEKRKHIVRNDNVISIEEIIGRKTGEIVICKAAGSEWSFGRPTLLNDDYFYSLCRTIPTCYRKNMPDKKKEIQHVYDVVSLFSGAGLLDYSFIDPKFRFVYAIDFDQDACLTYQENIGNHIVCQDIREVNAASIPAADVVIGGPCCQGYSNANRRDIMTEEAEKKRRLIDDYIRIVKEKKPKVFVIENVPQFYTKEHGLYIHKVLNELGEYDITCNTIVDSKVGGYTSRKRAIVIGSKIGKIELPDTEISSVKTVRDALEKVDVTWFNYNDVTAPREETEKAMAYVAQGGNWKDIPPEVHYFGKDTHSDRFRRLAWDEIAPTIVNWRKICMMPPVGNRILSVSEAAALMGLDKNFKILGKKLNSRQQQVGNGVTQAIGRFVKKYVLNALESYTKNIVAGIG